MIHVSNLANFIANLKFLGEHKFDVALVGRGNWKKKEVIKIQIKIAEYKIVQKDDLVILCLDNKLNHKAQKFASEYDINIFVDDVKYLLFDKFIEFKKKCVLYDKKAKEEDTIFQCKSKDYLIY